MNREVISFQRLPCPSPLFPTEEASHEEDVQITTDLLNDFCHSGYIAYNIWGPGLVCGGQIPTPSHSDGNFYGGRQCQPRKKVELITVNIEQQT